MKAFLGAVVALVAISAAAPVVLERFGFSTAEQAATPAVRLGD